MKTEASKYDEQAEKFLAVNKIKFRATLADSKSQPWKKDGEKSGHHFRVTLSKSGISKLGPGGRLFLQGNAKLTFDFWGSIRVADSGIETVTAYDVLSCISGDANCPETFDESCDEGGDDKDSIKALQNFRRWHTFAKRLRAFFTPEELERLAEIQ